MFCHKCGTQLSEEAVFCHKCGAKTAHESTPPQESAASVSDEENIQPETAPVTEKAPEGNIDVMLVSVGDYKVSVIKLVREILEISIAEAKELVEQAPTELKKSATLEEAELIKQVFSQTNAEITFTDKNGQAVNIESHCKKCGAVLSAGSDICPACGNKNEIPSRYGLEDKSIFSLPKSLPEFKEKFKSLPAVGKVIAVFALCFGMLLIVLAICLIVVIIKLIFSSIIALAITVAVGYFAYQRWGALYITENTYYGKSQELQLPEGMDNRSLFEALSGKFNYPYFKGVRYSEDGTCLIEGKYSEYPIVFNKKGIAELKYNTNNKENLRLILREAMAVHSYLNKFFNPTLPYDAIKELKKLKSAEAQQKSTKFVVSAASLVATAAIVIYIINPSALVPGAEVRGAYLTQYSEAVTIVLLDKYTKVC